MEDMVLLIERCLGIKTLVLMISFIELGGFRDSMVLSLCLSLLRKANE